MLTFIGVVVVAVIAFKLFMLFFSSSESAVERATRKYMENPTSAKEGANKQVISSQADSLIKISRIWA
ncbi:hypothetical protein QCC40_28280, partial [Klebsiella pneumoniae]|uniref:hypothetical protein n=1 Tax=Klebsiella pneumoniae TaxID=573 RepID=UPI00271B0B9B